MRRLATMLAVLAVAAIAIAASVDALVGSQPRGGVEAEKGESDAPEAPVSRTQRVLSDCRRDQLELAFENLGGDDAVVLRHISGGPCRLRGLPLHINVVDGAGRMTGLPLGETELGGEFGPSFEQVVGFNGCKGKGPLVATATAGPYSATAPIATGGTACVGPIQHRVVRLDAGRNSASVYVQALDPATQAFNVRVTLPQPAKVKVVLETGSGLRIRVLDAARRDHFCHRQGTKDVCGVPFAALEAERPGGWTLWVYKRSPAPAQIRLAVSFQPVG